VPALPEKSVVVVVIGEVEAKALAKGSDLMWLQMV
jgi:hypothetical protein